MKQSKIAVTGGLGSGKSAVCQILKDLGYPVFSCDEINRELWGKEGITNGTGNNTFTPDKTCSRGEILTFLYRQFS